MPSSEKFYDMVFEIDNDGVDLSPNEINFIADMIEKSKSNHRTISPRQQAWIERIWNRLFR